MRTESRQKITYYDVFISDDGKEFDNEMDCIHHEKLMNGERKVCPDCNGSGFGTKIEEWEDHHTGVERSMEVKCKCKKCGGKGYLEKKIITETIWV